MEVQWMDFKEVLEYQIWFRAIQMNMATGCRNETTKHPENRISGWKFERAFG